MVTAITSDLSQSCGLHDIYLCLSKIKTVASKSILSIQIFYQYQTQANGETFKPVNDTDDCNTKRVARSCSEFIQLTVALIKEFRREDIKLILTHCIKNIPIFLLNPTGSALQIFH